MKHTQQDLRTELSATGWRQCLAPMLAGTILAMHPKTRRFYADGHGSFAPSTIAALARDGVLQLVGAGGYTLTPAAAAVAAEMVSNPPTPRAPSLPARDTLDDKPRQPVTRKGQLALF